MNAEQFLKDWKKENNTDDAVYSSYHIDAMEAYAKYYHRQQVNSVDLGDVGGSAYFVKTKDGNKAVIAENIAGAFDKLRDAGYAESEFIHAASFEVIK